MRKVRSQRAASAELWVTSTRVEPLRARAANNSSMIAPPVASSRLPVGSSAMITDGRGASARASMVATMKPGNAAWAKAASLIVVVWSQADLDCRTPEGRDYYQFDTGMAAALLMLAATERNLSLIPLPGCDPEAARQALALPDGAQVITLIVVGGHTQEISPALAAWQVAAETERPARLPIRKPSPRSCSL